MEKIRLMDLGKGVYDYYRDHVRGNAEITIEQAQKKLTRNVYLARPAKVQKHPDKQLYLYGNLQMLVVGTCIVWMKNEPTMKHFRKDETMYRYYTEVLGISEENNNENVERYADHR